MLIYAVCCTSRSGSTYICDLLRATGRLGMPDEYANAAIREPETYDNASYFESIVEEHRTENGIFGIKVTPAPLAVFEKYFAPTKYVFLRRRNLNEQAVSFYRAEMTDFWARRECDPTPSEFPNYDYEKIAAYRTAIKRINGEWNQIFQHRRIEAFKVWYEDTCAFPEFVVAEIARFLGVEVDTPCPRLSEFQIMRDERTREWLTRLELDDRKWGRAWKQI